MHESKEKENKRISQRFPTIFWGTRELTRCGGLLKIKRQFIYLGAKRCELPRGDV